MAATTSSNTMNTNVFSPVQLACSALLAGLLWPAAAMAQSSAPGAVTAHDALRQCSMQQDPSARLAWSEVDDDVLLFASGQSRYLPGKLRELLKLVCSADALHSENLGEWLADEDGRDLLCELVKQGSLEFADE